ncbi:MAG: hypothetical protein KDB22_00960 [Planctomycetales bacterium]|nr:hypothetical protein [Planctomycetales bacterium]
MTPVRSNVFIDPSHKDSFLRAIGHDQLLSRAQSALASSAYRDLQTIRCSLQDGKLLLRGQASSFYMKQMAQSVVLHAIGEDQRCVQIVNSVEVNYPAERNYPHLDL